jgi:plasmid rolling circle replication initiator protein Rep
MEVKRVTNTEIGKYLERKENNYKIMEFYKELETGKWQHHYVKDFNEHVMYGHTGSKEFGVAADFRMVKIDESHLERLDYRYEDSATKAFQIASCMNWWDTSIYHENKTIELLRTFRCKDKFCTNCKRVRVSELLTQFLPRFVDLQETYKPMLLTITVPNVTGEKLRDEVIKMFEKYSLYQKLFSAKLTDKRSHKTRQYDVAGAIRALEVTYNKAMNTYHPHLHVLLFINDRAPAAFWAKTLEGEWCNVKRQHNMISPADLEIRELWTRVYKDIDRRTKNVVTDGYICDIRPIDGIRGILEVLKYSFKTRDIENFDVFYHLRGALHGRRLKQGYGCLYNLKLDDAEIPDTSENLFDELPESVTMQLRKLITHFGEYDKVKRFRKTEFMDLIDQYLED